MMFLNGSGVLEGADDATVVEATAIVHSELKAMLEGGDRYRDALKSVAHGTEHPAFVLVLLTETCVKKDRYSQGRVDRLDAPRHVENPPDSGPFHP